MKFVITLLLVISVMPAHGDETDKPWWWFEDRKYYEPLIRRSPRAAPQRAGVRTRNAC